MVGGERDGAATREEVAMHFMRYRPSTVERRACSEWAGHRLWESTGKDEDQARLRNDNVPFLQGRLAQCAGRLTRESLDMLPLGRPPAGWAQATSGPVPLHAALGT
jgi:hypothetical protein